MPPQRIVPLALGAWLAVAGCVTPAPPGARPAGGEPGAGRGPSVPGAAAGGEARAREAAAGDAARTELAALAGEYAVRLEDLGGAPRTVGRGTARLEPVLGGRFLAWETRMALEGGVTRARGLLGFDAARGEWQLLWASELGGSMSLARGRGALAHAVDGPAGSGLVLRADPRGPATVLRADGRRLVFEHWARAAEGERLVARTTYVRSGAPDEAADDAGDQVGGQDQ